MIKIPGLVGPNQLTAAGAEYDATPDAAVPPSAQLAVRRPLQEVMQRIPGFSPPMQQAIAIPARFRDKPPIAAGLGTRPPLSELQHRPSYPGREKDHGGGQRSWSA